MRTFLHVTAGTLLGLMLSTGLTAPSLAQASATPSASTIDFGDDSSDWAKDGECDDPRFAGDSMADQLVDDDIRKDATDCKAAFDAGKITLKDAAGATTAPTNGDAKPTAAADIDFGDDSSEWARDGECDDPRFVGAGAADELVDADLMRDATDCKAAFEAGTVTLKDAGAVTATAVPVDSIDFGDDSSEWARDGECDDPRFTGSGAAAELVEADRMKDATDCRAAFEAGTVTLKDTGTSPADIAIATPIDAINFGDDSSEWAKDGECDDPRFTGPGSAAELVDADRMKDATDCRAAYEAGTVTLADDGGAPAVTMPAGDVDFGDDSSEWAKDGECDDPRFTGTGVAGTTLAEDIKKDATDCKAAVEAGTATYQGEEQAAAFDFGSDFSKWANDGECDDLRFEGPGTNKKLLTEDVMGDATDCKALLDEGKVSIRKVYTPEYAAGAPYDSSDVDFGDNVSSYANDGECDDPRFEGPGAATTLLDSDRMADADDCKAAFEAGTIVLLDGES